MAPNHWHYLSPQRLWGFPRTLPHVKVRSEFMSNIEDPLTTTYIWFLCNGHGGPGHFVQVGTGIPHSGNGPAADGDRTIPNEVMTRLQEGFDHWFNWQPVSFDATFQDELQKIPAPVPTFIQTLRRVAPGHSSLPAFEALLRSEEQRHLRQRPLAGRSDFDAAIDGEEQEQEEISGASALSDADMMTYETDVQNLRREQQEPSSQGFVYLIHMEGTSFYKIGMSLDPRIRLQTLQTGNPHILSIRHTRAVSDMRLAETSLHDRFASQRVTNVHATEWFDFGGGIDLVKMAFDSLS